MSSYPLIIQGGMGIAVSSYHLAKAVSMAGQLGVVSGTAIDAVMAMRLHYGDILGNVRRSLNNFPVKEIGQQMIDKFYNTNNKIKQMFKFTMPSLNMSQEKENEIVTANFSEIFLAKEGHKGIVGINFLEKIQFPNLAGIYGALLAGIDYIIMGAGIPKEIPAVIEKLTRHEKVEYTCNVENAKEPKKMVFDPSRFGLSNLKLKRPKFLAIISSNILAATLMKKSPVSPDGFIIEGHQAGGHNAPPRVSGVFNENGEPLYGEKDIVDLEKVKELNVPFWLAGSYGTKEGLKKALAAGAAGIQAGTVFAFTKEAGFTDDIKQKVISSDSINIKTDPLASPTGFPFKVADIAGSLSDNEIYNKRQRVCNLGYLRTAYEKDDGSIGYRCAAEPVEMYVKKGGREENTRGRKCLCNALMAAAGFPLTCKSGEEEKPLITMGDDYKSVISRPYGYSAEDVVKEITGK
ncbi:nitronate monooxygenase [Mucispirillum schaedleri]|jgi:NAD(P)H-dependent flavin oxidoreductase YrpB (nitropropane dioxygenase family)|uniref:Uncharacterized protein n=1 Tax=Mucispirillum schaedleri ASF457 TaxID=1379858 RepID=V2RI04_9BACT|nr:nitronate monooxygenase [Mucispirillum schaedleri]MCX4361297.1 nitronate monooxygenase [Mucispirillum schaedleri]USF25007.1 hypothetical protein N508_002102 [Mucispirillum schaedleri ASF457]SIW07413.1 conserved hypothetical protein [Mucispirillum schaedleri ASF457]